MPPGKDRENAHISMPKELKEELIKEAARRSMSVSDLACERLSQSYTQEKQWQLDLQHVIEAISRKLDSLMVSVETIKEASKEMIPAMAQVHEFSHADLRPRQTPRSLVVQQPIVQLPVPPSLLMRLVLCFRRLVA